MSGNQQPYSRRTSQRGAMLAEASLMTGTAFLLFFVIFALGYILYVLVALEFAASAAGRYASLGTVPASGTRTDGIKTAAVAAAAKYNVSIVNNNVYLCIVGSTCVGTSNPGGPGDLIEVRVNKLVPLFLGGRTMTVTGSTVVQNEFYGL